MTALTTGRDARWRLGRDGWWRPGRDGWWRPGRVARWRPGRVARWRPGRDGWRLLGLVLAGLLAGAAQAEPVRIVALGPAVTEIVCALDAGAQLVGRDQSSTFPGEAAAVPEVGYYRAVGAEGLLSLTPDLVLASSHAGPDAALERVAAAGVRVVRVPDGPDEADLAPRVRAVAAALGKQEAGEALLARVRADLAAVPPVASGPRVAVVYARGPGAPFLAGAGTAPEALVRRAGGVPALVLEGSRPVTAEALVAGDPEVIVVPRASLEQLGGVDGLLAIPGFSATTAGRARRVVVVDDHRLLSFGLYAADTVRELRAAWAIP